MPELSRDFRSRDFQVSVVPVAGRPVLAGQDGECLRPHATGSRKLALAKLIIVRNKKGVRVGLGRQGT